MKKIALIVTILLLGFPQQGPCAIYTGNISYGFGLQASNEWADTSSILGWTVDNETTQGYWTYEYIFDVMANESVKNISHVITQVSTTFELNNLNTTLTTAGYDLDTYNGESQGNSNPGIPGDIFGMKWEGLGDSAYWGWTIVTDRAPMWGDFYAVDGKTPGAEVFAYNTGFGIPNLSLPADGNAIDNEGRAWVLVPDTTVIPIPGAVWLLGSGLLGLVAVRRRFKK
ncbi:MAG TPA: hypothetical protein PLR20_04580 [Syntrophales bacterium]|nr:hypothetical protein [Syntrophales bacterium]HOX94018.1 hypothetical protein [Syntrophales bacterium]HPI56354.1 hypothetical protein [Syntrophales bacterium]HPN24258.1 hypothetical protein [Syntrophales bacterium]HQM28611.1 hypothetical protein [Syntrophales bacterium]